jgi:Arc/MetJ family transcription regulator
MITKLFDLVREFYRNILLAREAAGLGRRGNVEEVRAFLQQATK